MNDYTPVAINLMIVIIGWWVLTRHAKKLSTRSETHSLVKSTDDILQNICILGRDFWLKADTTDIKQQASELTGLLGNEFASLRVVIKLMEDHSLIAPPDIDVAKIRQLVTLDAEYKTLPDYSRVSELTNLLHSYRENLLLNYRGVYRAV